MPYKQCLGYFEYTFIWPTYSYTHTHTFFCFVDPSSDAYENVEITYNLEAGLFSLSC